MSARCRLPPPPYNKFMTAGHECYHCKQWVEEGEAHDCWTTTESALTAELSEELRDAWVRLRDAATEFGEQRIYASHHSIMFSRKSCYFFVRPKRSFLEVCVFLDRGLKSPLVRRADRASKSKVANLIQIRHRDEVESPIIEWLQEAYALQDAASVKPAAARPAAQRRTTKKRRTAEKPRTAKKKSKPAASS